MPELDLNVERQNALRREIEQAKESRKKIDHAIQTREEALRRLMSQPASRVPQSPLS